MARPHACAAMTAFMLAGLAGSASAATFNFTNTLGNGLWFSEANMAGTWMNNWGQSGGAAGLPTPGAADTANLTGAVNGNGNISVAALNIPAGASLTHTGGSLSATTMSNNGDFGFTGGNRAFAGVWTNTASGVITWGNGAGWSQDAAGLSIANAGTLNLPGGANINGGTWSNAGLINKTAGGGITMNSPVIGATSGMIMSSGGTLLANSPTVTSFPAATWVTTAGAVLRLSSPTLSGTFVGNHGGLGAIAGNPSLAGNTTFSNTGAGTQPWVREGGAFSTGAFTLTNTGNLQFGAGNHSFSGNYSNSGTMTMDPSGWSYSLAAATTVNNTGTIVLNGGHNVNGADATSVINNNGAMTKANGGGSTIGTITLNNGAGGSINAPTGGITLNSARITSSPSAGWSTANDGAVVMNSPTLSGTFNGSGARFDVNTPTFAGNSTFAGTSGGLWNLRSGIDLAGFTVTNTGAAGLSTNGGNTSATNGTMLNGNGATWAVGNGSGWTSSFNGVTWTNNGLITVDGSHLLNRSGNPFVVNNNGTLRRDAGGTTTFNEAAFNHVGAINHVPSVTGLNTTFNGGLFIAGPSSSITIPVGALNLNSVGVSGRFNANLNGGSGNINSPSLTDSTTLNATGAQPWNVTGGISAGAFTLTNIAQSGFNIGGGNTSLNGTFVNASTGTVQMNNGAGWTMTLDNGTFTNAGTMNVPGSLNINKGINAAVFNSTGTINRTAGGTLSFNSLAATLSGAFNHDASNSNTAFNNGSLVSNGASYTIQSGSLGINGATIAGVFNGTFTGGGGFFSGCTLNGNVTLNTSGSGAWDVRGGITTTGFTFTNNGLMTFNAGGGNTGLTGSFVNASSGNVRFNNGAGWTFTLASGTVTNNGAMTVPGSMNFNGAGASTVLANNGTFTHENGGTLTFGSMTINNSGLMTNASGALTSFGSSPITQTATGVVRTPTGTRMSLSSSPVSGGRVEGTGNINGNGLTLNGARLAPGDVSAPSVGTLTVDGGSVTFGPGSSFEVDIDRVAGNPQTVDSMRTTVFNQTINLSGADLVVRRPSAGYIPDFNVEYAIVRAENGGSLTGTFANVIEANPLTGYGYRMRYTNTTAFMKVVKRCNLSDVAGQGQVPLFDGAATPDDIIVFVDWFFAGDLRADYASQGQVPVQDGLLTADDIIVFINLFFQGCGF